MIFNAACPCPSELGLERRDRPLWADQIAATRRCTDLCHLLPIAARHRNEGGSLRDWATAFEDLNLSGGSSLTEGGRNVFSHAFINCFGSAFGNMRRVQRGRRKFHLAEAGLA
jgi:hypothetical protein